MPVLTSNNLGKLCRELAAGLSPLPVLLDEWGLTPDDYDHIKASEGFRYEMTIITREMQELGADAGYVYRMKSLSEEFLAEIVRIMQHADTSTGTKVDLIKFCADMARLKEKPLTAAANAEANRPRGPSVIFNFGAGLPIHSMTLVPEAIDATGGMQELVQEVPVRRGFQIEPEA